MKRYFTSNSQQRFSNKIRNAIREISLLLLFIFSFTASDLYSQQKDFQLGFTFTPHQTCRIIDSVHYEYWQHYNWYSELKLNLWQGAAAGSNLQYHLTSLDSLQHYGMQGYYQPDTLMYAAFGKVSIHQAEETSDRYRYKNHHNSGTDATDNWQGQTQRVRYYEAIPTGPYTSVPILTELNENAENSYSGVTMDPIYLPIINDNGVRVVNNYYVKPRMRIDSVFAEQNPDKPVVSIVIKNFEGRTIDSVTIKCLNFLSNGINNYNGKYLEEFFGPLPITVRGDSLNVGRVGGYLEWTNMDSCHVDYQIYWFQEVSVWIDYVKIMDEPANLLFNPDERIRKAIKDKVKSLLDYDGSIPNIKGFFTEETDYSRLTCLKYLQEFLKDSIPI